MQGKKSNDARQKINTRAFRRADQNIAVLRQILRRNFWMPAQQRLRRHVGITDAAVAAFDPPDPEETKTRTESAMRKLTLTLLASAAIAMPALVPAMAQSNKPQQPNATQQQQQSSNQQQPGQPQENQNQENQNRENQNQANQNNGQQNQQQASQNNGQQDQQQADNQPIPPQQLGRSGVKQVQQALDKQGFDAGRADGIFGHETRSAVKDFQKSKGMQASGQIDQQTLSDLGVNIATNENTQNSDQGSNNNENGNAGPAPQPHGQ